jgi:hypothetical protein
LGVTGRWRYRAQAVTGCSWGLPGTEGTGRWRSPGAGDHRLALGIADWRWRSPGAGELRAGANGGEGVVRWWR